MLDQVLQPRIGKPARVQPWPFGLGFEPPHRQLSLPVDRLGDQHTEFSPRPHAVQTVEVVAARVARRPQPNDELGDRHAVATPADAPGRERPGGPVKPLVEAPAGPHEARLAVDFGQPGGDVAERRDLHPAAVEALDRRRDVGVHPRVAQERGGHHGLAPCPEGQSRPARARLTIGSRSARQAVPGRTPVCSCAAQ